MNVSDIIMKFTIKNIEEKKTIFSSTNFGIHNALVYKICLKNHKIYERMLLYGISIIAKIYVLFTSSGNIK